MAIEIRIDTSMNSVVKVEHSFRGFTLSSVQGGFLTMPESFELEHRIPDKFQTDILHRTFLQCKYHPSQGGVRASCTHGGEPCRG